MGTDETDPFIDTQEDLLTRFSSFSISISPVQGAPLQMERVIPQSLNEIMDLR